MKIKTGRESLNDFIGQAERDGDVYMMAHFSHSEDRYRVYDNLDAGDALVLIMDLCKRFGIDGLTLIETLNNSETKQREG